MPITLLHIAFSWPFRMKFKALSFAALTVGAMVPDLEPPIYLLLGLYPDRLVLHSLIGSLSVDIILTIIVVKLLTCINLQRIGIHGFANIAINRTFVISAAMGSLSHVLVDSLHHEHNSLLWLIGPTYFTGPLVLALGSSLASGIISALAFTIIILVLKRLLNNNGYSLLLIFKNPIRAVSVITMA